jgi:hypothetical protein
MDELSSPAGSDPWKPLDRIARAATWFGVLSIIHLVCEAVQLSIWGHDAEPFYFLTFLLEIPVPLLWLQSGRSLRERKDWALLITVTTASIALTDAVVPGILRGSSMISMLTNHLMDLNVRTGIYSERILTYVGLTVCAPLVLGISLSNHHARRVPQLYSRYSSADLWFAFAVTTVANSLVMALITLTSTG